MALPIPDLDDRRFPDLVEDATRLVRKRCPEWTDHNPSDPGVTLVETFAFMVDQLIQRVNQEPDRMHLRFLDLIGLRLFPPTPARAAITFWLSASTPRVLTVPAGTEVGTLRTELSRSVVFSTERDVDVLPAVLGTVLTRSGGDTGTDAVDRWTSLERHTGFPAFADPPAVGDELLVGLEAAVPDCAVALDVEARVEGLGVDPRHVPLAWQAWTDAGWSPCEIQEDGTGGLNTAGRIVLHVPSGHRAGVVDGHRAGWLRAVILEAEPGQRGYTASPTVDALSAATVGATGPAVHARFVENETLGQADGVPGERFTLATRPVLAGLGDPVVEVSSAEGWQRYRPVEHFAASGPDDRHVVLDGFSGEVQFGPVVRLADGGLAQHGAVPEAGATVRVRRYATGGGAIGNVAAGAVSTLRSSIPFVSAVENRYSAQGGVDGETLDQARDRGPLMLRTRSRAVTAEDYEALAREAIPSAARIRCITAGEADVPAGTVKVLVVPSAAVDDDGRIRFADLIPPEEMLETLADRLEQVRLVGTRVLVEPPLFRGVTVVARLVARPRVPVERIRTEALAALLRHLDPLPGGGPDGRGWPFGRPVRVGDLHAVLQRVSGVDAVEDVRLFTANPVTGERGTERNRIDLEANSLVFSFDHQVRVEATPS